mmetsp:Transcript_24587/g.37934  ORF Transcript_24587/g.37934 Transcript_24587/m.37934 type:complete len:181 (-) Transcript_24587:2-544(-)
MWTLLAVLAACLMHTGSAFVPQHVGSAFVAQQHAPSSRVVSLARPCLYMSKNESNTAHEAISDYRKSMSISRTGDSRRSDTDVVMKFGGSSLANSERIMHVTELIKGQMEAGYRPRAVVCSAMGKTTNSLLSAGDCALEGKVNIDAIRTLHSATMKHFDIPAHTVEEVTALLDEVRFLCC